MTTCVITVSASDTVERAVGILVGRGLSSAPVVDRTGHLVGIVSELDLLHAYLRRDPARAERDDENGDDCPRDDVLVREVMTSQVLTLEPTTDVWDAGRLLMEHGVKAAPVVRGGRAVGLVARRDLLITLGALLLRTVAEPVPSTVRLAPQGPWTLVAQRATGAR